MQYRFAVNFGTLSIMGQFEMIWINHLSDFSLHKNYGSMVQDGFKLQSNMNWKKYLHTTCISNLFGFFCCLKDFNRKRILPDQSAYRDGHRLSYNGRMGICTKASTLVWIKWSKYRFINNLSIMISFGQHCF